MINASGPLISRDTSFKSLSLPSLQIYFRYLYKWMRSALAFSSLNSPSSFSLSSFRRSSRSFITYSCSLQVEIEMKAQNSAQYSSGGLSITEKGRIISFHLLSRLLLMQPRILVACFAIRAQIWHRSSLLSVVCSLQVHLANLLLACADALHYYFSGAGIFTFLC